MKSLRPILAAGALLLAAVATTGCGPKVVGPATGMVTGSDGALATTIESQLVDSFQVETASFREAYRVGPDDVLTITVFRVPDLTGAFTVDSSGSIVMPLLGKVRVDGRTPDQIAVELKTQLGESYLQDPDVRVDIQDYRARQAVVMGAVKKPGPIMLSGPTSLIDAIAMAGGLETTAEEYMLVFRERRPVGAGAGAAARPEVRSVSTRGAGRQHVKINLEDLLQLGNPAVNVPLAANDLVYVPSLGTVFIRGPVGRQGEIRLTSAVRTISQVITMAGGLLYAAEGDDAFILRSQGSGNKLKIPVRIESILDGTQPDMIMRTRDEIVIPQDGFRGAIAAIGNFINRIFNPQVGGTLNVFGPV